MAQSDEDKSKRSRAERRPARLHPDDQQKGRPKKGSRRRPVPMPSMLDPWERQPNESGSRYQVFLLYRDQLASGLARRSLEKAARAAGKQPRQVEDWSRLDNWRDRVLAWDRHTQMVQQAATERRLREIGERHAQQLAAAAHAAMAPVVAFLNRLNDFQRDNINPYESMTLDELQLQVARSLRVLPRIVQAERLVHGMSTENVDARLSGGSAEAAEARRQAETMTRPEQERFLLGEGIEVDDVEGTAEDA